jgi:hypothetical protein
LFAALKRSIFLFELEQPILDVRDVFAIVRVPVGVMFENCTANGRRLIPEVNNAFEEDFGELLRGGDTGDLRDHQVEMPSVDAPVESPLADMGELPVNRQSEGERRRWRILPRGTFQHFLMVMLLNCFTRCSHPLKVGRRLKLNPTLHCPMLNIP